MARAQALLGKALAGFGGAEAVDGVHTIVLSGRMERTLPTGLLAVPVTVTYAFPDRMRRDVTLAEGTTLSTIVTSAGAFLVGPFPATPLPSGPGNAPLKVALSHPLALLRARGKPGFLVAAPGVMTRSGHTYEVLVVHTDGVRVDLLVGEGGRTDEMVVHAEPSGTDPPRAVALRYSDFRPVGALAFPHRVEGTDPDGVRFVLEVASVQLNVPLAPSRLDVPGNAN